MVSLGWPAEFPVSEFAIANRIVLVSDAPSFHDGRFALNVGIKNILIPNQGGKIGTSTL